MKIESPQIWLQMFLIHPGHESVRGNELDARGVRGSRFRVGVHAPDGMETFASNFEDFQIS